jgi:hypothetical protein
VERGKANKRRGSSIGLTRERLVEEDWSVKSPASGSGGAPTGTRTAVREEAMLNNALPRELPCGLGKKPGRSPGAEDRRRGELGGGGPAAVAGTRAPAIVRLGLINKRLGELLGCTRKSSSACGSGGVDWREVHTGGANGGTAVARGGCACARGTAGAGLLAHGRSVGVGGVMLVPLARVEGPGAWPATCAAPAANGAPRAVRRPVDKRHLAWPTCHGWHG